MPVGRRLASVSVRAGARRPTVRSSRPPRPIIRTASPTPGSRRRTDRGSGREFAFLTIFNKNRPGLGIVADFYTFALFDLDAGTYGTYTDYDMPATNMQAASPSRRLSVVRRVPRHRVRQRCGYVRSGVPVATSRATWCPTPTTSRSSAPTQHGAAMRAGPARHPVAGAGAAGRRGFRRQRSSASGRPNTYSYFQTGMTMTGTLAWGSSIRDRSPAARATSIGSGFR